MLFFFGVRMDMTVVYYNRTPSEPVGIYLRIPLEILKKGDYVVMHAPENIKGYYDNFLRENETLIKTVYALPGDKYTITEDLISINDKELGTISKTDSRGRILPHAAIGDFIVPEGSFVPLALSNPNSFDARYYGDVPQSLIVAKVIPLWVW
jgi:conjugative transfer signal peptidase TraF